MERLFGGRNLYMSIKKPITIAVVNGEFGIDLYQAFSGTTSTQEWQGTINEHLVTVRLVPDVLSCTEGVDFIAIDFNRSSTHIYLPKQKARRTYKGLSVICTSNSNATYHFWGTDPRITTDARERLIHILFNSQSTLS
jgi:hypothetical protein